MSARDRGKARSEWMLFSISILLCGILSFFLLRFSQGQSERRDQGILSDLAAPLSISPVREGRGGEGRNLFRIRNRTGTHFGAIMSLGEAGNTALLAVLFSRSGEVEALRFVGSTDPGHPSREESYLALFLGDLGDGPAEPLVPAALQVASFGRAQAFARKCRAELLAAAASITRIESGDDS